MTIYHCRMSFRQAGASQHGYLAMRDRAGAHHDDHRVQHRRTLPPPCHRCSFKQPVDEPAKPVNHYHYSGKLTKEIAMNSLGEYFCPSCMNVHKDYLATDRIKVVLTSSILYQYWAPPQSQNMAKQYTGDLLHIDHVGIPGANIDTLTQAFRIDYEREKRGMDVVIVSYYNDYLKGRTAKDILVSFSWLLHVVKNQATRHHPTKPNTLAVATLPYAPQLCWFPDNGPFPTPNYVNHLEELTWLNDEIIGFNAKNGTSSAPKLHTYGERTSNSPYKDRYGQLKVRHIRKHRFSQWREEENSRKLHMDNERRMAMATTVGKYFLHNTSRE